MILCVCPSPALDLTYRVATLEPGRTNRVREVAERPGGKAVNVARVLHGVGAPVRLLVPLDGLNGATMAAGLRDLGIDTIALPAGAPTRRTVTIVDAGHPTVFTEPSCVPNWADVVTRFAGLLADASVSVVSGSMPADVPAESLADLVTASRAASRPVVVDTSGPSLASALTARPDVVKPNADELRELTGEADALVAATRVARDFGVAVVASLGPDGLIAVVGSDAWRARVARPLSGNPTGAGDALVAGIALGLSRRHSWPDLLVDAVAMSAAAVLHPHAGEVDRAHVAAQRDLVEVTRIESEGRT